MKNTIFAAAHSALASLSAELDGYAAEVEARKADEAATLRRIETIRSNQRELELKLSDTAAKCADENLRLTALRQELEKARAQAQIEAGAILGQAHAKETEILNRAEKVAKETVAAANAAAAAVAAETSAARAKLETVHRTIRDHEARLSGILQAAEGLSR